MRAENLDDPASRPPAVAGAGVDDSFALRRPGGELLQASANPRGLKWGSRTEGRPRTCAYHRVLPRTAAYYRAFPHYRVPRRTPA
eukprot:11356421-Alexandrium_andersonii.AAC.1